MMKLHWLLTSAKAYGSVFTFQGKSATTRGEYLRGVRHATKLTLKDVALELGVDELTLAAIERDDPTVLHALEIRYYQILEAYCSRLSVIYTKVLELPTKGSSISRQQIGHFGATFIVTIALLLFVILASVIRAANPHVTEPDFEPSVPPTSTVVSGPSPTTRAILVPTETPAEAPTKFQKNDGVGADAGPTLASSLTPSNDRESGRPVPTAIPTQAIVLREQPTAALADPVVAVTPATTFALYPTAACPDARSVIASPGENEPVAGRFSVIGTAQHAAFKYYKLEYVIEGQETAHWLFSGYEPVINGRLATIDSRQIPAYRIQLRLTTVDENGNYPLPCEVALVIDD